MRFKSGTPLPSFPAFSQWLEELVEAFEAAWQRGERPAIDDYLATATAGRLQILVELVHADLECRLRAGEATRADDYLWCYPELGQDQALALDLLATEYRLRRRTEPELAAAEYRQRFPRYGPDLEARLAAALVEEEPGVPSSTGDPEATQITAAPAPLPAPAPGAEVLPVVPGYRILGELGRGGMGVVYRARQVKLKRLVALKMISAGSHAVEALTRFRREAEAVARLQHPNVVQIHEVGEVAGRPFFSLELVEGGSLADRLHGTPLPPRPAAQLVQTLARAMHAAHQRGIVHRDLKLANVLLAPSERPDAVPLGDGPTTTERYEPKVTDFGLAKTIDSDTSRTQSGALLGTPSYMAPEQALGHSNQIGPATDIYALGAVLYELLTGRPPFKGATVLDTIQQVVNDEPVAPSRLQPKVPRDLETVCLKCLQKEPRKRYASAEALAEDLRRFLAGEPILARPASLIERSVKWVRRRPAAAALGGVSLLAVLGVIGILAASNVAIQEKQRETETARKDLSRANQQLHIKQQETQKALKREQRALKDRTKALEREQQTTYFQQIALADGALAANQVVRAEQKLDECRPELRRWEWYYLKKLCHSDLYTFTGHASTVWGVAFSPDGKRVASASFDGTVKVWDAATGAESFSLPHPGAVYGVAFSRDGKYLASAGSRQTLILWDARTGARIRALSGHTKHVMGVAFSRDSRLLASCSGNLAPQDLKAGEVIIWDVVTGKALHTLHGHVGAILGVAFSPDGQRLASSSLEAVRVWDVQAGKLALQAKILGDCVAFSPDGRLLATTWMDQTVRLWDAPTGKAVRQFKTGHTAIIRSVTFSPDSKRLATTSVDQTVRLSDVASGKEVRTFRGHTSTVWSAAFSPDGGRLASAAEDQTVRLWDTQIGRGSRNLGGAGGKIDCLTFGPDSRHLAIAGEQGKVKVWDTAGKGEEFELPGRWAAYSPRGRRLATAGPGKTVTIWDTVTRKALHTLRGHRGEVTTVAFSKDGRLLASAGLDKVVRIWDAAIGKSLWTLAGHTGTIWRVAFSPDGSLAASAGADQTVKVWDARTGKKRFSLTGHAAVIHGLTFSPDGRLLASSSGATDDERLVIIKPGEVKLWDPRTGKELRTLRGHTGPVSDVVFSPDGRRLASAGIDKQVKIWDVRTGWEVLTLEHSDEVYGVAFSPDGRLLASAWEEFSGQIELWEAPRDWEIRNLRGHTGQVNTVAFSPDNRRLASASSDQSIKIWDATTGALIRSLAGHTAAVFGVAFSPDGKRLASAGLDKTVRLWDAGSGKQVSVYRAESIFASLAFSPNGKYLAAAGKGDQVHLLDGSSGKRLALVPSRSPLVLGLAFCPDSQRLAAARLDRPLVCWDIPGGRKRLTLPSSEGMTSVSFSGTGRRLASASVQGKVIVWDGRTGQKRLEFSRPGLIWAAALSPDGRRIATANRDGTLKLWDAATGKELRTLRGHTGWVRAVAFSSDGGLLASGSRDHTVKVWDLRFQD